MATPKSNATLQSRFGFSDPDLTTPAHDAILMWLIEDIQHVAESLLPESDCREEVLKEYDNWMQATIDRELQRLKDAELELAEGAPIEKAVRNISERLASLRAAGPLRLEYCREIQITKRLAEMPIMSGTYTVGFVDYYIEGTTRKWWLDSWEKAFPQAKQFGEQFSMAFEIKPLIPSFGELIRQLRFYEGYLPLRGTINLHTPRIIVVSPDLRFRRQIENEGFGFVESGS